MSPRYWPQLDGIRALAIVAVIAFHLGCLSGGWLGVDLFFVLSGYLITAIILKNGRQKHFLFHFYMRRGLRIWPIYYLTVLAIAAASPPRTRIDSMPPNPPRIWRLASSWPG